DVAVLKILKESLGQTFEKGTDGQKIADLYKSYVDFESRNKLGITPIKPYLDKIDAIKNFDDLYNYLLEVGPEGGNPFFGAYVYAHMKNKIGRASCREGVWFSRRREARVKQI